MIPHLGRSILSLKPKNRLILNDDMELVNRWSLCGLARAASADRVLDRRQRFRVFGAMMRLFSIVATILLSAGAQIMIKSSSAYGYREWGFYLFLGGAGLLYVLSFGFYALLLKFYPLSKLSPVLTIATMILVVLAGALLFKEVLSLRQALGLLTGFLAIVLILG